MNEKDIHKFYKFLKAFPEHHNIMKTLLVDYLHLKDENEKLVKLNLELLEDARQYNILLEDEKDLVIH